MTALQSIQTIFSTEGKMEWIRREAAAGVPQIQVGSFVPPKLLPQLADTAEVVRPIYCYPRSDGRRLGAEPARCGKMPWLQVCIRSAS